MKKIILITAIILMIAAPVFAQSQTYFHEVTIELDGEWDLNSRFEVMKIAPADASGVVTLYPEVSSGITLVGIGQARIHSITKANFTPSWWDLF